MLLARVGLSNVVDGPITDTLTASIISDQEVRVEFIMMNHHLTNILSRVPSFLPPNVSESVV